MCQKLISCCLVTKRKNNINVNINNTDIEIVYVSIFIGVLIDIKLNGKDRVSMIISKLSKSIAIMHRAKYLLDKNARVILYYSLFVPYVVAKCGEIPTKQILNAFTYYWTETFNVPKRFIYFRNCRKGKFSSIIDCWLDILKMRKKHYFINFTLLYYYYISICHIVNRSYIM